MTERQHQYYEPIVLNSADSTVVADTVSPKANFVAGKRFACLPGIVQ